MTLRWKKSVTFSFHTDPSLTVTTSMYALTIFISAFLLFQVQPLIARYILPWFGGSPAVWSTCMLFFQIGLLMGYFYAHLLVTYLTPRKQFWTHSILLLLSLCLLPITPGEHLKPSDGNNPEWRLIWLLLSTVGLPYIMVSSTGPLLQNWFGRKYPERSPYRLYSLSNIGSLLGLLTYPFLVEPALRVSDQTVGWSWGYVLFILVCITSAFLFSKSSPTQGLPKHQDSTPGSVKAQKTPLFKWLILSACGSVILLSSTSFVCQDIAVIPFLWVLPLSLYLVSFIITFDKSSWYLRRIWVTALLLITPVIFYYLNRHYSLEHSTLAIQLTVYIGGMFIACMVCHGELVRLKPPTHRLTLFYLAVSLGGALGGLFVTFLAPHLFADYWEFPLSFIVLLALASWLIFSEEALPSKFQRFKLASGGTALVGLIVLCFCLLSFIDKFRAGVLATERNFYGVLRVIESSEGTNRHRLKLYNGSVNHGVQPQDPKAEFEPKSYYSRHSGLGLAIRRHPIRLRQDEGSEEGMHVGIIGLGAGAISAYQRETDLYRYYELDPDVETLARDYFTFIERGEERTSVIIGDARISLERELKQGNTQEFDILVVDAFSGDAIPIHLLTVEAMELYQAHLKPDGILAIHISNEFFNLKPLVYGTAQKYEMEALLVEGSKDYDNLIKSSSWALLSKNQNFLQHPRVLAYIAEWPKEAVDEQLIWTDDFANVIELLY